MYILWRVQPAARQCRLSQQPCAVRCSLAQPQPAREAPSRGGAFPLPHSLQRLRSSCGTKTFWEPISKNLYYFLKTYIFYEKGVFFFFSMHRVFLAVLHERWPARIMKLRTLVQKCIFSKTVRYLILWLVSFLIDLFSPKIGRGLTLKESYFLWLGHVTADLIRIFKHLNEKKIYGWNYLST